VIPTTQTVSPTSVITTIYDDDNDDKLKPTDPRHRVVNNFRTVCSLSHHNQIILARFLFRSSRKASIKTERNGVELNLHMPYIYYLIVQFCEQLGMFLCFKEEYKTKISENDTECGSYYDWY
jgi:hypothetical protein